MRNEFQGVSNMSLLNISYLGHCSFHWIELHWLKEYLKHCSIHLLFSYLVFSNSDSEELPTYVTSTSKPSMFYKIGIMKSIWIDETFDIMKGHRILLDCLTETSCFVYLRYYCVFTWKILASTMNKRSSKLSVLNNKLEHMVERNL